MKVNSESEVAQSCPTIHDPMDCRLLGSSIHGIFQARVLEWGAIAFSPIDKYIFLLLGFLNYVTIEIRIITLSLNAVLNVRKGNI